MFFVDAAYFAVPQPRVEKDTYVHTVVMKYKIIVAVQKVLVVIYLSR